MIAAIHVTSSPGGFHRVSGTVDALGTPGSYLVRLFESRAMVCWRSVWSDDDGVYLFDHLPIGYRYVAVARDHNADPSNAAISDQLTLEPMP